MDGRGEPRKSRDGSCAGFRKRGGVMNVTVCDVGPRDGLQNDREILAPEVAR